MHRVRLGCDCEGEMMTVSYTRNAKVPLLYDIFGIPRKRKKKRDDGYYKKKGWKKVR